MVIAEIQDPAIREQAVGKMFGKTVKRLRKERGITGSQLARATGLSRQQIWKLEDRNKTLPPTEVFDQVAKALRVSKEYLLVESGYLDADALDWDLDERILSAARRIPRSKTDAFANSVQAIAEALVTE
jgi:transcriptional regulator with XRE-family HTH domain